MPPAKKKCGWLSHRGRWVNYGRRSNGIQEQKCSNCGQIRYKHVRPCFMFHNWRNQSRPNFGQKRQICRKCGTIRTIRRKKCFLMHSWTRRSQKSGELRCRNCGTVKPARQSRNP